MSQIILEAQSEPATPASGHVAVFVDVADDTFKSKNDAGVVQAFSSILPTYANLFPQFYTPVEHNSNTAAKVLADEYGLFFTYVHQGADVDQAWELPFLLKNGVYTLELYTWKWEDQGILKLFCDGDARGEVDLYDPVNLTHQVTSVTGFNVSSDGMHTLKGVVESKNASSSNYYARLEAIYIHL